MPQIRGISLAILSSLIGFHEIFPLAGFEGRISEAEMRFGMSLSVSVLCALSRSNNFDKFFVDVFIEKL